MLFEFLDVSCTKRGQQKNMRYLCVTFQITKRCPSYLQFSATLVMHLIALKWISGLVDVRMNSISFSSPSFCWISSTHSLSLRQLEKTFRVSTWRSQKSCKDKNNSKPHFLHRVSWVQNKVYCHTYVLHYWGYSWASRVLYPLWKWGVYFHQWWPFLASLKPNAE